MNFKALCLSLLMGLTLVIGGCEDREKAVIHNASVYQVTEALRDYVGLNGFRIRYANESPQRASLAIFVGKTTTVLPAERQTVFTSTRQTYRYPTSSILADTREHTGRIVTQESPAQAVSTIWDFTVKLIQKDEDVEMSVEAQGGFDPAQYARKFLDGLKQEGFTVSFP